VAFINEIGPVLYVLEVNSLPGMACSSPSINVGLLSGVGSLSVLWSALWREPDKQGGCPP